jgi:Uma2 family endonuclease
MSMPALIVDEVEIPFEVRTFDGFCDWYGSLPEGARVRASFIAGNVYLEMTPESYHTHEPVVRRINWTLTGLAEARGIYFVPPSWVTCKDVGLSTEPDGFLVTFEAFQTGRVRVNPERKTQLQGPPDFVFEAVSASSVHKDLDELLHTYARAGVPEYWLADMRTGCDLRILTLDDGRYVAQVADAEGWLASPTWARSFRLRPYTNAAGLPDVEVQVR